MDPGRAGTAEWAVHRHRGATGQAGQGQISSLIRIVSALGRLEDFDGLLQEATPRSIEHPVRPGVPIPGVFNDARPEGWGLKTTTT